MRILAGLLAALALAVAALVGLAWFKPVMASRLVWPLVEAIMLREPFVGITADGTPEQGLFFLGVEGGDTAPIVAAARAFVAALGDSQRERLAFPVDDLEWRRWANIHIATRQGVGLLEMDEPQSDAAFELLRASTSARGYALARDIMRLEGHLADLMGDHEQYGEGRYWFTLMGEPSVEEPWGWQLDGHHLVINAFVLGNELVFTPLFMGSEPTRAETGRYAGTAVLEAEQALGLELVRALNPEQRAEAVLAAEKTGNDNQGELFSDNAIVPYQGLSLSALDVAQRELAVRLIRLYLDRMPADHAESKFQEVLQHWERTRFGWVGGTSDDSVFYYRIHSPVLLIEFDHQLPVALDGPDRPSRDHVHTVVRTPNGNDYGKDLLRQHLARQHLARQNPSPDRTRQVLTQRH